MLILAREKVSVIGVSGREILVGKIHIRCDRLSGDHRPAKLRTFKTILASDDELNFPLKRTRMAR
jgi:hypothetical protein